MCGLMLSKEGVTPIKDVRNDGVVGKEEGDGGRRRGERFYDQGQRERARSNKKEFHPE